MAGKIVGLPSRMIQPGQETWALALDPNASTGGVRLRDVLESAEGAPEERLRALREQREKYQRRLLNLPEGRRAAGELALTKMDAQISRLEAGLAARLPENGQPGRLPAGDDIVEYEGLSSAAPPTVREAMSDGTSATRGQFGERPAETPEGQGLTADGEAEGDHASPGVGDPAGPGDVDALTNVPAEPAGFSERAVTEKLKKPGPPREDGRLWRVLFGPPQSSDSKEGNANGER